MASVAIKAWPGWRRRHTVRMVGYERRGAAAVVTDHCAPPAVRALAVLATGAQAEAQLRGIAAVRTPREVRNALVYVLNNTAYNSTKVGCLSWQLDGILQTEPDYSKVCIKK